MQFTRNSPTHSNGYLLCGDLSARDQCVNSGSLGYPPFQHIQPSRSGEHASSTTTPTSMMPMLAPDRNLGVFPPMDLMTFGYYYPTNPPLTYTPNVPRTSSYYPIASSGLAADAYVPLVLTYPLPPETSLDFGGIYSEPVIAPQPPTPPAAQEHSVPANPAVHSYECRWLSGPHCDGLAPGRNREMSEHLRSFHHFVGHERDRVQCEWENCGHTMQRMNVPRHIVSRHLLASASCRFCKKRFSRPDVVARHERTCGGGNSPVSSGPVSRV